MLGNELQTLGLELTNRKIYYRCTRYGIHGYALLIFVFFRLRGCAGEMWSPLKQAVAGLEQHFTAKDSEAEQSRSVLQPCDRGGRTDT